MKVTDITRQELRVRRDKRDRLRDGWLPVTAGGHELYRLHSGMTLRNHKIVNVKIAACGKALWVKTEAAK